MHENTVILDQLLDRRKIDINRGRVFDVAPGPMADDLDFARIEGMMLALAIGDALGNSTEGMVPDRRINARGEIRDYLRKTPTGEPTGLPSDDTQLAFWTLEQMVADRGFCPDRVAARFCRDTIIGIGNTVSSFVMNYKSRGWPWYECGLKSAGNGALMRIAPMVFPHLRSGTQELWVDTALSAMMTHNDSASIAACLSFVSMIWALLRMESPPEPRWWLDTYVEVAKDLEFDQSYRARGGAFKEYEGTIWRFAEERVSDAFHQGLSVVEACDQWYSGAYLLETIPSALYILMRHGDDLEEAVVRAANDTKDNDTIAAIVGAAVGALHGKERIPERWVAGLSGRTGYSDDGRVFQLLEQARDIWWE